MKRKNFKANKGIFKRFLAFASALVCLVLAFYAGTISNIGSSGSQDNTALMQELEQRAAKIAELETKLEEALARSEQAESDTAEIKAEVERLKALIVTEAELNASEVAELRTQLSNALARLEQAENSAAELQIEVEQLSAQKEWLTVLIDESLADVLGARSFGEDSWEIINAVSRLGLASLIYPVSAEKTITIAKGTSAEENITLVILGYNHDNLADGSGRASLSIGMKNLLAKTYPMNGIAITAGSWENSAMRRTTMQEIFDILPVEVQNIIKPVIKLTGTGSMVYEPIETIDNLWLMSITEIRGTSASPTYQGEQYKYFDGMTSWVKYLSNGEGSSNRWWSRSPATNSSTTFDSFAANVTGSSANAKLGVSFGFCI